MYPDNSDEQKIVALCRSKADPPQRVGGPGSPAATRDQPQVGQPEGRHRRMWLNEAFAAYVVCFSEEGDLVTQWNTYAGRGSGFSIGIERQKLAEVIASKPPNNWLAGISAGVELIRVQYSEKDQIDYFRGIFDKYLNEYNEKQRSSRTVLHMDGCAGQVVFEAALSASWFKHSCFKSEAEWRIVITSPGHGYDLFFRPSARTVIPYVKIPRVQSVKQEDRKLPIVSITIGPTLHQELWMRSVQALLVANGYSTKDVEIRKSELPLALTD
jgi:hypothetical protein